MLTPEEIAAIEARDKLGHQEPVTGVVIDSLIDMLRDRRTLLAAVKERDEPCSCGKQYSVESFERVQFCPMCGHPRGNALKREDAWL